MRKTVEELLKDAEKLNPGNHLRIDEIANLGAVDEETFRIVCNAFALGFLRGMQTAKNRRKKAS